MTLRPLALVLALGAALSACATTATAPEATPERALVAEPVAAQPASPPASEIPRSRVTTGVAYDQLYALAWMQTSTEYQAIVAGTYAQAKTQLVGLVSARALGGALAQTSIPTMSTTGRNALVPGERTNDTPDDALAIVVDVDETVLDNTPYNAMLILEDAVYEEESWDRWCNLRAAKALPGAVDFAQFAAHNGITMFYVTNRKAHLRDATADNLRAQGFPVADDNSNVMPRDDARGWTKDKGSRRSLIDEKYRVVMMLGDNLGDFIDGAYADNATRTRLVAPQQGWWGERWFMLPNPDYGSWVDAATKYCRDPAQAGDPRACMSGWLRTP
ncbi:MAG TPA: HAD family acid phosphatase [Xanthomonadales bacterium]|nr:HAD family acid phosphatase [Xanthomonadales bacterium]